MDFPIGGGAWKYINTIILFKIGKNCNWCKHGIAYKQYKITNRIFYTINSIIILYIEGITVYYLLWLYFGFFFFTFIRDYYCVLVSVAGRLRLAVMTGWLGAIVVIVVGVARRVKS